jgi:hypothetical protein
MVPFAKGNRYGLAAGPTESKISKRPGTGLVLLISHIDVNPRPEPLASMFRDLDLSG